jgi:HEPN domain-containing protein
LNKLFNLCDQQFSDINNDLVNLLDSLYIESRYPGDIGLLPYGKPTLEDAKEFYLFADTIFKRICTQLALSVDEIKAS